MSGQNRYYSSTAQAATVTDNPLLFGSTTVHVSATTGFPASFPYTLIIDRDTANEEVVTVTAAVGLALTVTRGVDGTAAVQHAQGATVEHGVSARDFAEPQLHINDASVHYSRMPLFVGSVDPAACTDLFTLADGDIHYYAFRAQENAYAEGVVIDVTTAGGASSDIEVGLFEDGGGSGPTTLLQSIKFTTANSTTLVSPAGLYGLIFPANVPIHAGTNYWIGLRSKAGSGAATLLGKASIRPEAFQTQWDTSARIMQGSGTALASNPTVSNFTDTHIVSCWILWGQIGNIDFG